jgi:hypothetical protein
MARESRVFTLSPLKNLPENLPELADPQSAPKTQDFMGMGTNVCRTTGRDDKELMVGKAWEQSFDWLPD